MTQKEEIKQKEQEIVDMAKKLCLEKINEEYATLAEKMILKLGRKRNVPFISGISEIWATAVIHAIGQINFLSDKSFLPYLSLDDLCDYYGCNKNTVGAKAGQIRKMLKLGPFDMEFSTKYSQESNPLNQLRLSEEGFLLFEDTKTHDTSPIDLPFLDKVAIFVRPKQPFINWINEVNPRKPWTLDDFYDGNTYLLSSEEYDIVDKEDIEQMLAENYIEIFENELQDVCTDTNYWPETINLDMFKEWFEYHVSSMVYDLD
ncbi:MAG: DUF6398 domain-containing protein [Bacteroidales bacterium]|nr:hypothetical protein [Lentimicrobiaceae bacterium]MDD5696203.1 DUF6398 domain-containing protein [Bacteroidales bacterium]